MQCSARKFLASQALYGTQIAHPDWTREELTDEAIELSNMLIRKLDREEKERKGKK
jgi:predicted RNA polymerase sigma factor